MRHKPEVSVIIVNWNGVDLLRKCLESLRQQIYQHFEIIIVDNASTDGSTDFVERQVPEAKLLRLARNRGFAGGNIEGLKAAQGDYIALLNNDTVAAPEWLHELVKAMEEDPRVGICASKLIMHHQPDRIDSAGDGCVTSGHGFKQGNREAGSNYSRQQYVFGACAAAALYRREMIDDIGFLDEDFFINCEDTDLNFRAQLMGWKCLFVPTAVVVHKVSSTLGQMGNLSVYYLSRNEEFVWAKNLPARLMIRYLHHKLIQELGGMAYFCIRLGKWRPYLRGKWDAMRMLPKVILKRKEIQLRKRVDHHYLETILTPIFQKRLLMNRLKRLLSFH